MMSSTDVAEVERLTIAICPLLAGHPPSIVGAVLADLLAILLASHHSAVREEFLTLHIACVRALTAINERMMDKTRH